METKEYKLLDGRTIRAKYNRLERCNISKENLESFVKEFNASYRQAKILEKIKENYALMKADEHKKGKWILLDECANSGYYCSECHKKVVKEGWSNTVKKIKYCPNCGAEMDDEDDRD